MELGTWSPDDDEFPPPLPPTKIPQPVTTEPMGQKFQCCVCRTSEGVLTCTRCRAARYCEKACQKKQWPKHKDVCAKIKAAFEETERAADSLKIFKESSESEAVDLFKQYFDGINIQENVDFKRYDTARWELIYALESCGEDNQSELAFDLAAGNFMDVMKFRHKEYWCHEGVRDCLLSYLINANLDQEAFDFVRYFYLRKKTQEPLPYLSIEPEAIETSFAESDIGDLTLCDRMAIALVKYKRMRYLEFQELCETVRFKNFLMGTHPQVGKNSHVLKIRGRSVIVNKLFDFVLKPLKMRILKLHEDIEIFLKSANTSNRYVIPGLLNPESLPPIDNRPMWLNAQGLLEGHGTKEEGEEDMKVRNAWEAVRNTQRAWRFATITDKDFLEEFVSRGRLPKPSEMPRMNIMISEHRWKGRECNLKDKELYGHSFTGVLNAKDKELYLSSLDACSPDMEVENNLSEDSAFLDQDKIKGKDANLVSTEMAQAEEKPVKHINEFENLDEREKRRAKSVDRDISEKCHPSTRETKREVSMDRSEKIVKRLMSTDGSELLEREEERSIRVKLNLMPKYPILEKYQNGMTLNEIKVTYLKNDNELEFIQEEDISSHVFSNNVKNGEHQIDEAEVLKDNAVDGQNQISEVEKVKRRLKVRKPNCVRGSCQNKGRHRCSRCKAVFYCQKECLNEDWPHHKMFCDYVFEANKVPDDSTTKNSSQISGDREDVD